MLAKFKPKDELVGVFSDYGGKKKGEDFSAFSDPLRIHRESAQWMMSEGSVSAFWT
jgi:hypothetical protein